MFSFFKSKKSPASSPSEPTRGDDNGTDFVVVGASTPNPEPLYPAAQLPPAPHPSTLSRQYSLQYPSYTQNVPFKLHPIMSSDSNSSADAMEYKIREINHIINQISSTKDYDFNLERSIVEQ